MEIKEIAERNRLIVEPLLPGSLKDYCDYGNPITTLEQLLEIKDTKYLVFKLTDVVKFVGGAKFIEQDSTRYKIVDGSYDDIDDTCTAYFPESVFPRFNGYSASITNWEMSSRYIDMILHVFKGTLRHPHVSIDAPVYTLADLDKLVELSNKAADHLKQRVATNITWR